VLIILGLLLLAPVLAQEPQTEITKWQDGKAACVSLTYDDSSINQFRIDIPLLNDRNMLGTFFIITGNIQGTRNQPTFTGRPIMDILRESEKVPTTKENSLERISMLNYLETIQRVPAIKDFRAQGLGRLIAAGKYTELGTVVDAALAKLRQTGATYSAAPRKASVGDPRYPVTWDEIRRHAAKGHEFASHTISHPYTPALDEANIVYEAEKSKEDILEQLGPKHTFSIEAPYGIHDPHVQPILTSRFHLTRNWVTDDFMEGFLRDDRRDPAASKKEYVQWQRGPLTRTTMDMMKGWVDTSIANGIWLVLVFHGIEGIGWEPLTTDTRRAYYDYMKQQEGHLWIATFQDGVKYARERVHSKLTTTRSGESIAVTLNHSLDPRLYDLPLTARTMIPADWRIVRFDQGGDVRWLPVYREGDKTWVMYRMAPNGKPATLEKAPN
jgi:peptidoglycan/xylan/chitin deacetylase (PgdA/CDA1 family)